VGDLVCSDFRPRKCDHDRSRSSPDRSGLGSRPRIHQAGWNILASGSAITRGNNKKYTQCETEIHRGPSLQAKTRNEKKRGSLDDSQPHPERVDEIPVVRISVHIENIHAKDSSFLGPSGFEA